MSCDKLAVEVFKEFRLGKFGLQRKIKRLDGLDRWKACRGYSRAYTVLVSLT
jgi:hypothetical protein